MQPALPAASLALVLMVAFPAAPAAFAGLAAEAAGGPALAPVPVGPSAPLGVSFERSEPEKILGPVERFIPRPAGTVDHLVFHYGPQPIPAGWDFTRLLLDFLPVQGFITQLRWRLVDVVTGEEPTNLQVHIHHALWFPAGKDLAALSMEFFKFGTGEERTQLDLEARSDAEPGGPRYGLYVNPGQPLLIALMLHNKDARARVVDLEIPVTFVHGSASAIEQAQSCNTIPPLSGDGGCAAGEVFHELDGSLWGDIFQVPREAQGDGAYLWPPGAPLGHVLRAHVSGTMVFSQGHVHPGGMEQLIVNLGPEGSGCEADLDDDGWPGTTLLRPRKFDRDPAAFPFSEDFQMGVTKPGFRAPIREGDRIGQWAIYGNADYASWDAMSFSTLYVDVSAPPLPRFGACALADFAPHLVDDPAGDPTVSVMNRPWDQAMLPVCGPGIGAACDTPPTPTEPGQEVPVVTIANFLYVPGDQTLTGALGAPPVVREGSALTFVNLDGPGGNIRHTITSCKVPCNGPYVANYPLPEGTFESGKLWNLDMGDRGSIPPDQGDDATWSTPPDLPVGSYAYFCRIHQWMRGGFEVVA